MPGPALDAAAASSSSRTPPVSRAAGSTTLSRASRAGSATRTCRPPGSGSVATAAPRRPRRGATGIGRAWGCASGAPPQPTAAPTARAMSTRLREGSCPGGRGGWRLAFACAAPSGGSTPRTASYIAQGTTRRSRRPARRGSRRDDAGSAMSPLWAPRSASYIASGRGGRANGGFVGPRRPVRYAAAQLQASGASCRSPAVNESIV